MSITQKRRAKIVADGYKKWDLKGKRTLDVGCGNGVVADVLRKDLGLVLTATDIIDYSKKDIPFRPMSRPDRLPFGDQEFDYAMFNDVLHHAERAEPLLAEGIRVAKYVLVFEDRKSILLLLFDRLVNFFYARTMPCPMNFKREDEWRLIFDKLGLKCEVGEVRLPWWYPFGHMVFRLSKDR